MCISWLFRSEKQKFSQPSWFEDVTIRSPEAQKRREALKKKPNLVAGFTLDQMNNCFDGTDLEYRIVRRDGRATMVNLDLCFHRANYRMEKDKVTEFAGWY